MAANASTTSGQSFDLGRDLLSPLVGAGTRIGEAFAMRELGIPMSRPGGQTLLLVGGVAIVGLVVYLALKK